MDTLNADGHKADELAYSLPDGEIELRKRWLEFGPEEEALIAEIDPILEGNLDKIIANMYEHFMSFEETRAYFPDETILKRASSAQKEYFRRLTKGNYNADYLKDRLRVGTTHYRIELDPKWYLGAYSRVMEWIMLVLQKRFAPEAGKLIKLISAISKLIFLDMGLAFDTYIAAKEAAIRKHRDAIAELETERRVTKSLLENAPLGIVELDDSYRCVECNAEFIKMLDLADRKEIIGQNLFEIAPNLPRIPFEQSLKSGQAYHSLTESLQFSKAPLKLPTYWDWATWPMKDRSGKILGLIAKFSSATDRVLLQQQREDFVATLTHDLKTPILAANRAVKLLIEGDFGPILDQQVRILETIHESNEAMYKLVLTLLDVYRYDSGAKKLNLSAHNLTDIINQIVNELKPLASSKAIKLETAISTRHTEIACDEEEIRRVLQNLIDNSLKFTPSGGTIIIRLDQSEESTTVYVQDTGKGIPPEDMPKLFQRFWQAASSGRYYASTGLGLYLCRKIIEMHNGRIWCESQLGKGSCFAFMVSNKLPA